MAKKGSKPEIKKKDILELLRQGHTIQQALSVRKIPTSTFYSWRRKDDHYDGLVEIARTEGEKVKAAREEISASYVPMKDWQREFLHYYVRTGGVMQETCNLAGVELQDVLNYLDPRS